MRVMECLRLRVKDVEFTRREIIIREGNGKGRGNKDLVTVLPENLILLLQAHLAQVQALYQTDLAEGFGRVYLPNALDIKYKNADKTWGWQYVFPSRQRSVDPRSDIQRRHHIHEQSIHSISKSIVQFCWLRRIAPRRTICTVSLLTPGRLIVLLM
jgi:integrase